MMMMMMMKLCIVAELVSLKFPLVRNSLLRLYSGWRLATHTNITNRVWLTNYSVTHCGWTTASREKRKSGRRMDHNI